MNFKVMSINIQIHQLTLFGFQPGKIFQEYSKSSKDKPGKTTGKKWDLESLLWKKSIEKNSKIN